MVGATCQPLYTAVPKENNVLRCSALFYILDNINIMYSQGKAYDKNTLHSMYINVLDVTIGKIMHSNVVHYSMNSYYYV